MSNPTLIILRHGPQSFYSANMQGMPEGEPYEATIVAPDGSEIAVLYLGGHDGVNRLIGGGIQEYDGDLTKVIAPKGTEVIDKNNNIWVSNGTSWQQLNGGGSFNYDYGSYW